MAGEQGSYPITKVNKLGRLAKRGMFPFSLAPPFSFRLPLSPSLHTHTYLSIFPYQTHSYPIFTHLRSTFSSSLSPSLPATTPNRQNQITVTYNKANPKLGAYDYQTIHSIIDEAPILHVSFIDPEQEYPVSLPMLGCTGVFGDDADESGKRDIYVHG